MKTIDREIQIIKIQHVRDRLEQMGTSFERRYFTAAERHEARFRTHYCQYLASRLAAKTAVLSQLGRDGNRSTSWQEIEIQKLPSGQPIVVLFDRTLEVANQRGITQWLLSISHTPSYAAASAIAQTSKYWEIREGDLVNSA